MSHETEILDKILDELREIRREVGHKMSALTDAVTANTTAVAANTAAVDAAVAAGIGGGADDAAAATQIAANTSAIEASTASLTGATPQPLSVPAQAIDAAVGAAVASQLAASGGTPPYVFTAATLSSGLSLDSTGLVIGSVATAGTYTDTVTVADSAGATASGTVTTTAS